MPKPSHWVSRLPLISWKDRAVFTTDPDMPQFLPWENADELLQKVIRNGVSNSILMSNDLVTISETLTNGGP